MSLRPAQSSSTRWISNIVHLSWFVGKRRKPWARRRDAHPVRAMPGRDSVWRSCHGVGFLRQADKPFCPLLVTDGTLAPDGTRLISPMRADVRALAFGACRKTGIDFCGIARMASLQICAPERRQNPSGGCPGARSATGSGPRRWSSRSRAAAALRHELEQATTGMIVLDVGLEMLGQVGDALGEDRDLHLGRTGIAGLGRVFLDESPCARP